MLLAELLFCRDAFDEAVRAASLLDAAEPIVYPLYLRPSLELRVRIADRMRNPRLAEQYRRRIRELTTERAQPVLSQARR